MKIQRIGSHQRFVVMNSDGEYWAGVSWASSLREARVFAQIEKAEKVIRVLSQQLKDIDSGRKFVARVVVTTSTEQPVGLNELRETLNRHVCIDNQIEGDCLVLDVKLDWDSLKEQYDD